MVFVLASFCSAISFSPCHRALVPKHGSRLVNGRRKMRRHAAAKNRLPSPRDLGISFLSMSCRHEQPHRRQGGKHERIRRAARCAVVSRARGTQWKALVASNLGWTFDGFEVFALILTVGVALHQLLDPSQYQLIPAYAGVIIAITVFGWGIGGLLDGVLADYLGRRRSMTLTILAYSVLTGLSALSWDWLSFAAFRFLVGLAIGSEWV